MSKEDVSITYENNIFYCTKNNTKWISVDGEEWYAEEKRIAELESKIADIKANCDLAIEGRDVKIKELELELTVEKDLHQEEINLHLHAEEYTKELEQQIEKMKCCGNCSFNYCERSTECIDKDGNRTFHCWNEEKEKYCDVGKNGKYQCWELGDKRK